MTVLGEGSTDRRVRAQEMVQPPTLKDDLSEEVIGQRIWSTKPKTKGNRRMRPMRWTGHSAQRNKAIDLGDDTTRLRVVSEK